MDELVARLLCYGVRPSSECLRYWETFTPMEKGFIQGVSLLLADRFVINTAILDTMVESPRACEVRLRDGESYVYWNQEPVVLRPVKQPAGVWTRDRRGRLIGDYVRLHSPGTLFFTPVRECVFGAIGRACEFCTYVMRHPEPLTADELVDMLSVVLPDVHKPEMAFGGGTPQLRDHGATYYAGLVKAVMGVLPTRCSVELVPPPDNSSLQELLRSGLAAVIMSLELWDDAVREKVCPGKAVVSKDRYREAWQRSLEVLGEGTVSSVFLVGIESIESTIEGIDKVIEWGVLPTLIPFRAYDNTPMQDHEATDHEAFLRVARYAASRLAGAGLTPATHAGCAGCGGCSLEKLLLN